MREGSSRRWSQVMLVAAGVLMGTGCRGLPETGGRIPEVREGNFFAQRGEQAPPLKDMAGDRNTEQLPPGTVTAGQGYNGTIHQIGSSIDPRTPRLAGQEGASRWDDPSGMMQERYSIMGGATYSPTTQGLGGEDGAEQGNMTYRNRAAGYAPLEWQDRNERKVR